MYTPKPGKRVYRLRRLMSGYNQDKYFPATEDGLAKAMRAWRRLSNRRTGQCYGSIQMVEVGKGSL